MFNKAGVRAGTAIAASVAVMVFGWPAVASANPEARTGQHPARAASAARAPKAHVTVPAVGRQFTFSTKTEATTSGPAASSGAARPAAASPLAGAAGGAPQGLFVAPQPVTSLAALTGTNGGVVSVASGEFSASGHQDVAAVICNPCGAWGQPPFRPSTDGTYSIAVLPGNGDGTFGTPTQLSPVGPNIALSMIAAANLGNGHTDLIVSEIGRTDANPYQLLIYLGNGDGTFQSTPLAVDAPGPIVRFQVADLGNGHPDLVALVSGGPDGNDVVVFTGNGTGNFTAGTPMGFCPGSPSGCETTDSMTDLAVAPLASGGKPDILVAQASPFVLPNGYQNSTDDLIVFTNNGNGTFSAPSYPVTDMDLVTGIEVGNFDVPSGPPDVLLVGNCTQNVISTLPGNCQMLLTGNGDGTFQAPSLGGASQVEGDSMRAAVADTPFSFTSGGPLDALWLSSYGNNQSTALDVMTNNGTGAFTRQEIVGVLPGAVYASTALPVDLAGDGQPDLVVGGGPVGGFTSSPGLWVVPANTKNPGTFLTAQSYLGFVGPQADQSAAVGDFRSSGHQDILTVTDSGVSGQADLTLLPGNGDGTFGTAQAGSYGSKTGSVSPRWGLISADFNGDGKQDIAYVDAGGELDYQLGNGDGTFGSVVQVPANLTVPLGTAVDVVETTLNGEPDIIASAPNNSSQMLESWLWNPATSAFGAPVVSGPFPAVQGGSGDIAVGHFKPGDLLDLAAVLQPSGGVPEIDVLTGNADGSFSTSPTKVATPCAGATGGSNNFSYGAIAVGNLGNGHDDIVWQCISALYVALGNGDGTFQAAQSYGEPPGAAHAPPGDNFHMLLTDLEGNGHLDAVAYGGDYNVPTGMAIWHNNGDGTFAAAQLYTMGVPENNNLGKTISAGALTTSGTDDLMVVGDAGDGNDDLTVWLTTGGRPALEATQVSAPTPASPVPGNIVTGSYQVTNTGGAVSDSWVDSVYLAPGATGTAWSDSDPLLERVPQSQTLGGGGSYTGQYRFPLGDAPAGTYHLIVVPDSSDVLSGGNETPAASPAFTVGQIPTLTVGTPIDTSIQAGQSLYYQLSVTAGTDVQVAIAGLPAGDGVTLVGQNGRVPTAQSATIGSASASVTVPGSSPGTWYIVIQPSASVGASPVPITVSASDLGMTLDTVTPASHSIEQMPPASPCEASATGGGGKVALCPPPPPPPPAGDGMMTLTLQGSGFGSDLSVQLADGATTYTSTNVTERDSTLAFASFPVQPYLGGLPVAQIEPGAVQAGVYNVVLSSAGKTVTLTNGFTVNVRGYRPAPAALSVSFSAPDELRLGFVGQLAVTLTNNAPTDLAIPVIDVSSSDAVLGAPGVTDTTQFTGDLEIDDPVLSASPLDDPSPPGILGAGQSFTLDLSILADPGTSAHAPLATLTSVVNSSDSTPIAWGPLLAPFQPPGMSSADWNGMVSNFGTTFGHTMGAFAMDLFNAFNQARKYGVSLSSEADAMGFLVNEEIATYPGAPVSGTIHLNSTSQPLGNASLELLGATPSTSFSATSWYDGRFAFLDVVPGTYELVAPGYLPTPVQTVDVAPTAQGLSVVAQSGASISGKVTDQDGTTPVNGAVVTAVDSSGNTVGSNTTGNDGTYTITGLAAGSVTVSASAVGYETAPDATATVSDGATTDLNLELQQDGVISGAITAPGGGVPAGATVDAEAVAGGPVEQGTVNGDGTYSVEAPPGSYTVVAEASGDAPAQATPVVVSAGSTTTGVDLQLGSSPATVSGVVTDTDTGAPVAGATLATDAANGADGPVTTAADGSYSLAGLPAGPVTLSIVPPDGTHLLTEVSFTATAGQTTTENATLDPAGAVDATVFAGDGTTPLTDVSVEVVGPSPGAADDPEQSQTTTTDSTGQAGFTGLPAGTYDMQVVGSNVHQAFIIASGTRTATLSLTVPTGTVSGQVVDASGKPLPGANVDLNDATGPVATTQTDTNGDYSFTVSSAGAMDVVVYGSGFGPLVQSGVTVATGQNTAVPVMREGAGSLGVRVTSGGNAVQGASVVLAAGASNDQPAWAGASTDASGSATVGALAAGTYQLQVNDGTDASDIQQVTLTGNADTLAVAMTAGGSVTGTVSGAGSPLGGATVSAVSETSGLMFGTPTASDGAYSVGDLPPGTYDLSVSAPGYAPTDVDGVTVTASTSTTENVNLSNTGASLTVSLAAAASGPIPAVNAVLEDSTGTPVATQPIGPAVLPADSTAKATFSTLSAGNYTLVVSGPGLATATQPVVVAAGPNSATVTAPAPEAMPAPITAPAGAAPPAASPASAIQPTTTSSTAHPEATRLETGGGTLGRTGVAPASLEDALGVNWLSQWYYGRKWTSLIPDPNSPQDDPYSEPYPLAGNGSSAHLWMQSLQNAIADFIPTAINDQCFNPYLAKAKLYAQLAQQALNHWQADYDIIQREAAAGNLEIGRQSAFFVAAIALLIATVGGAAAGTAVNAVGSLGVSGSNTLLYGGILASLLELSDNWANPSDNLSSNAANSNLNNAVTVITSVLGKLGASGPATERLFALAKGTGEAAGPVTTVVNLLTADIGLSQAVADKANELAATARDAAAAEGNFWNYLSYADYALNGAYDYRCPSKPQPNPALPQPVPEYPYDRPVSVHPGDPNEILGPTGDGSAAQYVDPGTALPYTVFFKNEPNASAAATEVVVTMPLPAGTDPSTLQLTGFGFGQTSVPVEGGVTSFSQMLTGLNLANGDDVSASGSYDPGTNTITWTLEAINPATGDVDGTPQGGFLPPDDAAGDGEGYVSFQVNAKPNLATGTKINAKASIVFDTNAAISTNTWVNTIDASAPTATVAPLPSTEDGAFTVSWTGKTSASPIATYNVYASTDNGPWKLWQSAVKVTSARYPGQIGHLYQFAATATDRLGHTSAFPARAQTFTADRKPTTPTVIGYRLVASDGGIFTFGTGVGYFGSTGGQALAAPIVGMATTPDGKGYWLAGANGRVFAFGDARNYGSTGPLSHPVVGIAATPDGKGYWLVGTDGSIYHFGDAQFYGSTAAVHLNKPIVGMAASPDGKGYWLAATDGGIFTFGDARFYGSTGAVHLNKPIVGIAASSDGKGYWLVATDGGIFDFGDARFYGSTGAVHLNKPIVGMAATPDGKGYWLVATDGGIFEFGDARFFGSTGAVHLNKPIVGMSPVT